MSRFAQEAQKLFDALRQSVATPVTSPTEAKVRAAVRVQVFKLDPACICGECRRSSRDQMHEIVYRSKTRNMAPERRFSTANCVRVSGDCHAKIHAKTLTIVCDDPQRGANGPVRVTTDGRTHVYQRRAVGRPTRKS